jgi:replicative superfamily II helicase
MGLNLNIKKIIFNSIERSNKSFEKVRLTDHEIQQIAGRAGRGTSKGYVQCVSPEIL